MKELRTTLRHATIDDIPVILALERAAPLVVHWSELTYRSAFRPGAPERIVLVAEEEGSLQGFLIARVSGGECELENLVVAAEYRRRGVGMQLLQSLAGAARERAAKRILLEVRESNAPARQLYIKFGYSVSGIRKSYYTDPIEDAVVYAIGL